MALVEWDDSFAVGNFAIDTQHQMFISLINRIALHLERDADKGLLEDLLRELLKYAEFHFISEENMMKVCGYDGTEHKKEHQNLLAGLRNRLFSLQHENIDYDQLFAFLLSWFKKHTSQMDRELAQILSDRD